MQAKPAHDGKKQAARRPRQSDPRQEGGLPVYHRLPAIGKTQLEHNSSDGKRAIAILDEVEKDYKTDKKRVYLTGLSMGGFGTWSRLSPIRNAGLPSPQSAAAATRKVAEKIKDIPCWCFHGDADKAVNVQNSRDMIKALKDAGGEPRYDEYAGVGHNSWDRAYATAELYTWFLKHSTK